MDEAAQERSRMPTRERVVLEQATTKLALFGPHLPFPHQSDVRGGRSPWRALYGRIGDVFVVAAVGPEAGVNPREFERMVRLAIHRLEKLSYERPLSTAD